MLDSWFDKIFAWKIWQKAPPERLHTWIALTATLFTLTHSQCLVHSTKLISQQLQNFEHK